MPPKTGLAVDMSTLCSPVETEIGIRLEAQPVGVRAVYVVDVGDRADSREVEELFQELESRIQVRRICVGRLIGYAVQAHRRDAAVLDAIEDVLRESFACVVVQRAIDESVLRLATDLCRRTGSRVMPVPRCAICGTPDPFPAATVSLSTGPGQPAAHREYCVRCTAEASRPTNKEFVKSLLAADRRCLGALETADIERRPSRCGTVRFRIRL
ncbi:MAG: hypothetical protein ACP5R5_03180 [Armatimonadota bacterium]